MASHTHDTAHDHPAPKGPTGRFGFIVTILLATLIFGFVVRGMITHGYGYAYKGILLLMVRIPFALLGIKVWGIYPIAILAGLILVAWFIQAGIHERNAEMVIVIILALVVIVMWMTGPAVLDWLAHFNYDPHHRDMLGL